jgi:hypothetical protein
MALQIGIGYGSSSTPLQSEPSLWLESDGYYWFLHASFERLRDETGQYIDLYGDALFAGAALVALGKALADATKPVMSQPETWQVHIGTQIRPEYKELYAEVEKIRFAELLVEWGQIIARAKELCRPVVCVGD